MVAGRKQNAVGDKKPPIKGRFKPGESGNPAGKKPGTLSLKNELRKALAELCPDDRRTWARATIDALMVKAVKGDVQAARMVFEYIDGKPDAKMEIEHSGSMQVDVMARVESLEADYDKNLFKEIADEKPRKSRSRTPGAGTGEPIHPAPAKRAAGKVPPKR
jgi:hypothetical protein